LTGPLTGGLLLLDVNVYKLQSTEDSIVHGWWYAFAMQRIATSPLNKVLATNGAGKQQGAD